MSGKFVLSSGHLDPGWDGDADQGEVTLPLQGRQVKLSLARGLEIGVSQHLPRDLDINLDSNIVHITYIRPCLISRLDSQWAR